MEDYRHSKAKKRRAKKRGKDTYMKRTDMGLWKYRKLSQGGTNLQE